MNERYSRLFTLPENLYAVGSPVVIAAGTLLKDNQTGKIVAQLKLRSISNKVIKAVKVSLNLFDTAGNPIGNALDYEYLDLDVSRDTEFGQKNPVFVAESKARSYKAAVTEVVFADKTTWTASDADWEPLPRQKTLDAVLVNAELIKQYKITVGSNLSYYPLEEKDLWYCACGALNRENESCHTCHRSLFKLQTIDLEQLSKDRDARLVQEAAVAEAKAAAEKAATEAAKKKTAKILKITTPAVCAVAIIALLLNFVIIPNSKYNSAVSLMEAEQYKEAIAAFEAIDGYKDSEEQIKNCQDAIAAAEQARIEAEKAAAYDKAVLLEQNGEIGKAAISFTKLGDYRDAEQRSSDLWSIITNRDSVAAGFFHTVAVKQNGTVVATGDNEYNQCNVKHWTDVIAISAGNKHTVGLRADGTVIATGDNEYNQCNVKQWTDIVAISAGYNYTVGLKSDGTVVAAGRNYDGECNVQDWHDIISVSAGSTTHTTGLKSDGTVVAVGYNEYGQCDIGDWKDIIEIHSGGGHTVGLKSDGSVIAVGLSKDNRCDVDTWSDIIAISAEAGTIGLKSDGTIVIIGSNTNKYEQRNVEDWANIVAISSKNGHTVGLKSDGTVVAAGFNDYGQCDVSDWTDIRLPN